MKHFSDHAFTINVLQKDSRRRDEEMSRRWRCPTIEWLRANLENGPLMYHFGALSEDCVKMHRDQKEKLSAESKHLRKIRRVVLDASKKEKVILVQKRVSRRTKYGKPAYEYWSYPMPKSKIAA